MSPDLVDSPANTSGIRVHYANLWPKNGKQLDGLVNKLGMSIEPIDVTEFDTLFRGPQPDAILLGFGSSSRRAATYIANFKASPWYRTVPLIALIDSKDEGYLWLCMEWGCDDVILRPRNLALLRARVRQWAMRRRLRDKERRKADQAMTYSQRAAAFSRIIVPLGVAMIAESDFDVLLEMILTEARRFCNADGGTIYLVSDTNTLDFKIVVNVSMKINYGTKNSGPPPFDPITLKLPETDGPAHIACHVAMTGETVNVEDVYAESRFDVSGAKEFDQKTGYVTRSILTIALRDQKGHVIGVLQLINATAQDVAVTAFSDLDREFIEALSRLAGQALDSYRRMAKLRRQANAIVVNIDTTEKAKQVESITSSEYFKKLKATASALRDTPQPTESANTL